VPVPLLIAHDHSNAVGFADIRGNDLYVKLSDDAQYFKSSSDIFKVFGTCGFRVLKTNGPYIVEFVIVEFSLIPNTTD
jgi:hypothetical protein